MVTRTPGSAASRRNVHNNITITTEIDWITALQLHLSIIIRTVWFDRTECIWNLAGGNNASTDDDLLDSRNVDPKDLRIGHQRFLIRLSHPTSSLLAFRIWHITFESNTRSLEKCGFLPLKASSGFTSNPLVGERSTRWNVVAKASAQKRFTNFGIEHQVSRLFKHCSIHRLSKSFLLWIVEDRYFVMDSRTVQESFHFLVYVLQTVVSEPLDLITGLIFRIRLEILETIQNLFLRFYEVDEHFPTGRICRILYLPCYGVPGSFMTQEQLHTRRIFLWQITKFHSHQVPRNGFPTGSSWIGIGDIFCTAFVLVSRHF